jgi:RNA polymerase sigma-B factor
MGDRFVGQAERTNEGDPMTVATRPRRGARSRRSCVGAAQKRREHELLADFARTRSPELREQLVERFLPLARSLARRYQRRTEPFDDLLQVASLGLVKAIDGFDPERGREFAAYAVPTILGELRRHFRDRVWNLRLPRALGELSMEVDKATNHLSEDLGRSPTVTEIAVALDVAEDDVLEAIEADKARKTTSMDESHSAAEEGLSLHDRLGETEFGYERVEANLAAGCAELSEREERVLRMCFVDNLTQSEVGGAIGLSQMQISRIRRRALKKLLGAVQGAEAETAGVPMREDARVA